MIQELPYEVLSYILRFITRNNLQSSIWSLAQTCKYWFSVVFTQARRLTFFGSGKYVETIILQLSRNSVYLLTFYSESKFLESDYVMRGFFTELVWLNLSACIIDDVVLLSFVENSPFLQVLWLDGASGFTTESIECITQMNTNLSFIYCHNTCVKYTKDVRVQISLRGEMPFNYDNQLVPPVYLDKIHPYLAEMIEYTCYRIYVITFLQFFYNVGRHNCTLLRESIGDVCDSGKFYFVKSSISYEDMKHLIEIGCNISQIFQKLFNDITKQDMTHHLLLENLERELQQFRDILGEYHQDISGGYQQDILGEYSDFRPLDLTLIHITPMIKNIRMIFDDMIIEFNRFTKRFIAPDRKIAPDIKVVPYRKIAPGRKIVPDCLTPNRKEQKFKHVKLQQISQKFPPPYWQSGPRSHRRNKIYQQKKYI